MGKENKVPQQKLFVTSSTSRHKHLICLLNAAENCDFNHLVTAICTRYLFYLHFRIFPGPYSVKALETVLIVSTYLNTLK